MSLDVEGESTPHWIRASIAQGVVDSGALGAIGTFDREVTLRREFGKREENLVIDGADGGVLASTVAAGTGREFGVSDWFEDLQLKSPFDSYLIRL